MQKRILQTLTMIGLILILGMNIGKGQVEEVETSDILSISSEKDFSMDTDEVSMNELALVENEERKEAFVSALEKIVLKQKSPDDVPDEDWYYGYNEFAIYDVNLDGREELLIKHNSSMSDSKLFIYEYDEDAKELRKIFKDYLEVTFYENGIIKVLVAHNQTDNDFWPYSLYCLDEETNTYMAFAYVDSEAEDAEITEQFIGDSKIIEIDFVELPIIRENVPG